MWSMQMVTTLPPIVKGKECVYATFDDDGTAQMCF